MSQMNLIIKLILLMALIIEHACIHSCSCSRQKQCSNSCSSRGTACNTNQDCSSQCSCSNTVCSSYCNSTSKNYGKPIKSSDMIKIHIFITNLGTAGKSCSTTTDCTASCKCSGYLCTSTCNTLGYNTYSYYITSYSIIKILMSFV